MGAVFAIVLAVSVEGFAAHRAGVSDHGLTVHTGYVPVPEPVTAFVRAELLRFTARQLHQRRTAEPALIPRSPGAWW